MTEENNPVKNAQGEPSYHYEKNVRHQTNPSSNSSSSSPPLNSTKINLTNKALNQKNSNILPTSLLNIKSNSSMITPQSQTTTAASIPNTKETVTNKTNTSNNDSINGSSISSTSSSSSSINGEVTAFNSEFGEEKAQSNEDLEEFINKSSNVQAFLPSSPTTQNNNDW